MKTKHWLTFVLTLMLTLRSSLPRSVQCWWIGSGDKLTTLMTPDRSVLGYAWHEPIPLDLSS